MLQMLCDYYIIIDNVNVQLDSASKESKSVCWSQGHNARTSDKGRMMDLSRNGTLYTVLIV